MSKPYALITGASGLLGHSVCELLNKDGYTTIALKHKTNTLAHHQVNTFDDLSTLTRHFTLVINLAGAPIAGFPWTDGRKRLLRASRIDLTHQLVESLKRNEVTCDHFISGSAIGFYGPGAVSVTETAPPGDDFSAQLCQQWEAEALGASNFAQRTTVLRTGLVFSAAGGFLKPLILSTRLGVGAIMGSGGQGISWIDHTDWLGGLKHIIKQKIEGAVNLTSPAPVRHDELMKTLSTQLGRPLYFKVPEIMFSPVGEMKTLFLEGQFVLPSRLLETGYQFRFPTVRDSLAHILS